MPRPVPILAEDKVAEWMQAETKKEWKRILGILSAQRVLTAADQAALYAYASAAVEYRYATAQVQTHGQVVLSQSGVPVTSPWIAAQHAAFSRLTKLLPLFGLSPSDRAKSKVDTSGEDQKDGDFF